MYLYAKVVQHEITFYMMLTALLIAVVGMLSGSQRSCASTSIARDAVQSTVET